jgi:hypothetical protein
MLEQLGSEGLHQTLNRIILRGVPQEASLQVQNVHIVLFNIAYHSIS